MKPPRNLPNWVGATAFVVALFTSIGWAASMIALAFNSKPLSESSIQLLSGLGGVLAGATSSFLGAGAALIWQQRSKRESEDEETELDS